MTDHAANPMDHTQAPPAPDANAPAAPEAKTPPAPLRTDGPTLAEWVKAGYPADKYPPEGYAVKEEPVVEPVKTRVQVNDEAHAAWRARKGFYNGAR